MTAANSLPASQSAILSRISKARFLTVSLVVHMLLVLLCGSVVIVRSRIEDPPDFVSGEGAIVVDESTQPPTPPQPSISTPPEGSASSAVAAPAVEAAPVAPAIVSTGLTANPMMAPMPVAPAAASFQGTFANSSSLSSSSAAPGSGAGIHAGTSTEGLGQKEKIVNAFVGTFYDLKQTRSHRPTGLTSGQFHTVFRKYIADNWAENEFATYFHAPEPIYATQIFTPSINAADGPKAFGLEKVVQPSRWLVHYRARVSPPESGVYHFVGAGDDVMVVRFNGQLVLDRCWAQSDEQLKSERNYIYSWSKIPNGFAKGTGFRAEQGMYYDMDVLIGEEPGGWSWSALLVEQEGAEYAKDARGNPILPVFRFADAPLPPSATPYPPHMEGGPVWDATNLVSNPRDSGFDKFFKPKNTPGGL